jgi:hypothetical protein
LSNKESNNQLRERSGSINHKGKLVDFLYTLMRDHVPAGNVERLVREAEQGEFYRDDSIPGDYNEYTNGWLAKYAIDLADRLK